MSLKSRLRRLDAGVRWLETEGKYLFIKGMVKTLEMLLDIADRADVDPAFAAHWKKSYPFIVLPPPRRMDRASPAKSEPVPPPDRAPAPKPVIVPQTPPSPEIESPRRVIEAQPPPRLPEPPPPESRPPEPRPPEPRPPEPMPGMPVSPPSPDMEIRPVRWRQRGPQDYDDDEEDDVVDGTNGRCLTEYNVFRHYDDDG